MSKVGVYIKVGIEVVSENISEFGKVNWFLYPFFSSNLVINNDVG